MRASRFFLFISSLIMGLFWTNPANEDLYAQTKISIPDTGTNYALIIGIEKYDDRGWGGDSVNSVNDADAIYNILTEKYNFDSKNVTLLTDKTQKKPDRSTILDSLDGYKNRLTDRDNLLIFYSGHSLEDDEGQTYWIPGDGPKSRRSDWLKHEDLCNDYFENENFKAKNVTILTDSDFTKNLLRPSSLRLFPTDFQYSKKILQLAKNKSRQVISFGKKRWNEGKKYNNLSLFTYFVHKALKENWYKVIDYENLIYNQELRVEAGRVAATKIIRGRLKQSAREMTGQAVISCTKPAPPIDVVKVYADPPQDEAGKPFTFTAETDRPAVLVYLNLDGRKYPMKIDGSQWKLTRPIKSSGEFTITAVAVNEDNVEGEKSSNKVTTLVPAGAVKVASSSVDPKEGEIGRDYTFTAKTDTPANKVNLEIAGRTYAMKGSGTDWSLTQKIEDYGNVNYSIVALNDDGIEGLPKNGSILINAPDIKITNITISPSRGFAGDEFSITASTDYPALSVKLIHGGKTYNMQGSGKAWQLKREITEIGRQSVTVIAKNKEGEEGAQGIQSFETEKSPPRIAKVYPPSEQAETDFSIRATTTETAREVIIEIAGKKTAMTGSGKEWKYPARFARPGKIPYKITAKNEEGKQGKTREGTIEITKKEGIDVTSFAADKQKGYIGDSFTWRAVTKEPAKAVMLTVEGRDYRKSFDMKKSGNEWTLTKKIDTFGDFEVYAIAKDSNDKPGRRESVSMQINDIVANVISASKPESRHNYAGEEFAFTAETDNRAESVILDLNGSPYEMKGSDNNTKWEYRGPVIEPGIKTYKITAANRQGITGKSREGQFEAKYAVINVEGNKELFAGNDFSITANLNAPAKEAFIEIDSKKFPMTGSGTSWNYSATFKNPGQKPYRIVAISKKDGIESQPEEGIIRVNASLIKVESIVDKKKGYVGQTFNFKAKTEEKAESVLLYLAGKSYPMQKSGDIWTFSHKIMDKGEIAYSVTAVNRDNKEGPHDKGLIAAMELTQRYTKNNDGTVRDVITQKNVPRYVVNDDGKTVIDRYAGLMITREPLKIAQDRDGADKEIMKMNQDKDYGYTGWRLPEGKEWGRIMDTSQENPALPLNAPFRNVETFKYYWVEGKPNNYGRYTVADLARGKPQEGKKSDEFFVWPVRALDIEDLD